MNICYFGDYDRQYSRNRILIKGLRKNGQIVTLCNEKSPAFSRNLSSFIQNIKAPISIFSQHSKISYESIIVGVPITKSIWLANLIKRKPLLIDPFVSIYNSLVIDRKRFSYNSLISRLLHILDRKLFLNGRIILADTKTHAKYFSKQFNIPINRFRVLYIGADDELHFPMKDLPHKNFIVGFFGSYIPLQGINYILGAADILKSVKDIRFEMVGGTMKDHLFRSAIRKVKNKKLTNVTIIPRVPYKDIPKYIQRSDIQLGIFGDSIKTRIVIPNKAYETIAMRKPLITGNTTAIRELFTDKKNCLLANVADSESIAEQILDLYQNPSLRLKIQSNGYKLFMDNCTPKLLGKKLLEYIREL